MRLRRLFILTFTFFLILWGFTETGFASNLETAIGARKEMQDSGSKDCVSLPHPIADSRLNRLEKIQVIDSQIEQLEDMKRGYEARALKHDTMAEYLQFDQKAVLETRRHLQLADENRNKAALVQEQIDRLNAKKKQLQS